MDVGQRIGFGFLKWLREYNGRFSGPGEGVGFHGLDMYSLYSSIGAVLDYLDQTDPDTALIARQRYGCLSPFASAPSTYGASALTGRYRECEEKVVAMLRHILEKQPEYSERDGWRFLDAAQSARLIASAEKYYRIMYYGGRSSWNLRDEHMFDTLKSLLEFHGPDSKAVVWAHNSHLGDAAATEMGARGESNVRHLCRKEFGGQAFLVGRTVRSIQKNVSNMTGVDPKEGFLAGSSRRPENLFRHRRTTCSAGVCNSSRCHPRISPDGAGDDRRREAVN